MLAAYCKTALVGWGMRSVAIGCKCIQVFILLSALSKDHYAALAVLGSLEGWFLLLDFGFGPALQNSICESRAKGESPAPYFTAGVVVIAVIALIGIFLIAGIYPFLSRFFLGKLLPTVFMNKIFLLASLGLFVQAVGSIGFKILMAQGRGSLVYLIQGSSATMVLLFLLIHKVFRPLSLHMATFYVFCVPAMVYLLANMRIFSGQRWGSFSSELLIRIGKRASHFFFVALLASLVTLSDAWIVPRMLTTSRIIEYNLLCKIFGVASLLYACFVQSFSPYASQAIAEGNFQQVVHKVRVLCGVSCLGALVFTFCVHLGAEILSDWTGVAISTQAIWLFGLYISIRIFCDFHAAVLQSCNQLVPFFIFVPIQAVLSMGLQYLFSSLFSVEGILLGLTVSYAATVFWVLPKKIKQIPDLV